MWTVRWLEGLLAFAILAPCRLAEAAPTVHTETEAEKRERGVLLAQALPEAVLFRSVPALAPVVIGMGAYEGYLGVRYGSPLLAAGGASMIAGGVGFYLASERHNYELVLVALQAGMGFLYLGPPFEAPHPRWQIPLATGHFVTTALASLNFAYSTHPGRSRLVADLRRVRTPAGRHGLSQVELLRIERDLYDTDPFLPGWLLGLPTIAGGLLGAIPILQTDVAGRDKPLIAAFAGFSLLHGLGLAFAATPADHYRTALGRAGLWATWTPTVGGVSVVGGFD